jgi:hypothetical protein
MILSILKQQNTYSTQHLKKSELGNLHIGEITFSNLPVSFFEGAIGKQKMSVLGMDIFKRFNLLFDLENNMLYLKKSKLFREDFRG